MARQGITFEQVAAVADRGFGSNGTKNQRKKNIRTFHRIALKSSGTETYASKMPL